MSKQHPIIAVTGSFGSNRGVVRRSLQWVFRQERLQAAYVDGNGFYRHTRKEMRKIVAKEKKKGNHSYSYFGPRANLFDELHDLFKSYSANGTGRRRQYLHTADDVREYGDPGLKPGRFTPWEDIPGDTDLMFYEGLHGCVKTDRINLIPYSDLKIGVVPVINLEWIQKIHRDIGERGEPAAEVVDSISRRMDDYIHYILPQFSETDVNFQRVPVVDTANPIAAPSVPTADESLVVIGFRDPDSLDFDCSYLTRTIPESFMSRPNSVVIPGGSIGLAMELVFRPLVSRLIQRR